MDTPFKVHEKTLNMSVSVGVSRWPDDGNTADELLRHADYAMYEAKQNLPVGVEALVRWLHPERGLVSPAEFIPIAEELGYIEAIGTRVLDLALAQVSAWQGTNLGSLRMSVNIAAPQFQCEKFADDVSAALTRHRVAPALLELEVTESVVMRDIDSVAQRLERRCLGGAHHTRTRRSTESGDRCRRGGDHRAVRHHPSHGLRSGPRVFVLATCGSRCIGVCARIAERAACHAIC